MAFRISHGKIIFPLTVWRSERPIPPERLSLLSGKRTNSGSGTLRENLRPSCPAVPTR
jgi:hypothetical protein